MKEEEKFFKAMLKSVDVKINPPKQAKARIFCELQCELNKGNLNCSFYGNYLLVRVLKLSVPITILITVCTGISAA